MKTPLFKIWVPLALISCGLTGLVYAAVQQDYRQSANDPQIQMAEDAAVKLGKGVQPEAVVGTDQVEATTSLAPFITVYDGGGAHEAQASSGRFDGHILKPPPGVFDHAKAKGEHCFTWQTASGQREAAVLVYNADTEPVYVLAARNLREVEIREGRLTLMTMLALAGVLGLGLLLALVLRRS
jgi:hypothetical protein